MKDHEIIELYWARNESAITATAEKYGNYCHTIAYNIEYLWVRKLSTKKQLIRYSSTLNDLLPCQHKC